MDKIKVKREGREGVYLVEPAEAVKLLTEKEIHCFVGNPPLLIGADWPRADVEKWLLSCERVAVLTGDSAKLNIGHALVAIRGDERKLFDVGKVSDEDLEITE